jgi:predicted dinucleotide-binding enzyme
MATITIDMAVLHMFRRTTMVTDLLSSSPITVTAIMAVDIRATIEAIPATMEVTTTSVVVTAWVDIHDKVRTVAEPGQSAAPMVAERFPEVDRTVVAAFRFTSDARPRCNMKTDLARRASFEVAIIV